MVADHGMKRARRRGRDRRRPRCFHCVGHVDPPHRPRELLAVPHRRQARRACWPRSTTSRERTIVVAEAMHAIISPPLAAASRSRSRARSSASPTRSTWPRAARACRSRPATRTSTRCRPTRSTRCGSSPGEDKAVRVEIEMSNSAGIFQVDEGLGNEAARHAAGRAHRGHRAHRGRAREAPRAGVPVEVSAPGGLAATGGGRPRPRTGGPGKRSRHR